MFVILVNDRLILALDRYEKYFLMEPNGMPKEGVTMFVHPTQAGASREITKAIKSAPLKYLKAPRLKVVALGILPGAELVPLWEPPMSSTERPDRQKEETK